MKLRKTHLFCFKWDIPCSANVWRRVGGGPLFLWCLLWQRFRLVFNNHTELTPGHFETEDMWRKCESVMREWLLVKRDWDQVSSRNEVRWVMSAASGSVSLLSLFDRSRSFQWGPAGASAQWSSLALCEAKSQPINLNFVFKILLKSSNLFRIFPFWITFKYRYKISSTSDSCQGSDDQKLSHSAVAELRTYIATCHSVVRPLPQNFIITPSVSEAGLLVNTIAPSRPSLMTINKKIVLSICVSNKSNRSTCH